MIRSYYFFETFVMDWNNFGLFEQMRLAKSRIALFDCGNCIITRDICYKYMLERKTMCDNRFW